MGWRNALRLSRVGYRELAFQAIYAVRLGNTLPERATADLRGQTDRRVLQSKIMVATLLSLMGFVGAGALDPRFANLLAPNAPPAIYAASLISGVLLLQLSFLWTTGLQILPTFLSSRFLPLLETLPLAPGDRTKTGFLLYLRLFDLPAAAVLVVTPLSFGWALGSPLAGLVLIPGTVATVLLALGLALATGTYFVRRIQGSPAGLSSTVLRWLFLVLWAVPAFAIYAFISFSPEFLSLFTDLSLHPTLALTALVAIFPFPFGFLPSLVLHNASAASLILSPWNETVLVLAAGLYLVPLALLGRWLYSAPRRYSLALPEVRAPRRLGAPLRTGSVVPAIIRKDLRVASRSPAYAFVVLLPLLDALVLGLSTFVGHPSAPNVFRLGAAGVSTAALLATFFGPAFFATEVMGYSYTRTLPLGLRALLAGKVSLIVMIYGLAAILVLAFTIARVFLPGLFLAFVLAELPAIVAAAMLEIGLLYEISARRGLAVTNLYTGAWWAALVVIPGIFVAGFPLAAFSVLGADGRALLVMVAIALIELGLVLPFALRWSRGRR